MPWGIPLTFSQEYWEASKCMDVSKWSVFVWFKVPQVVFNRIQRTHIQNTILIDDSPHKNLLNNPFNVVHIPVFGADHTSSPHDYLMTTLWPYMFRLKCIGELVQRCTREAHGPRAREAKLLSNVRLLMRTFWYWRWGGSWQSLHIMIFQL